MWVSDCRESVDTPVAILLYLSPHVVHMRAASLPAWAALFVEGARLLRESGYLSSPPAAPVCEAPEPTECALCPVCAPRLSCPEPRCETSCPACPAQESATTAVVLGAATLAVATSQVFAAAVARRGDGRARTAPHRRGGGVVDES